MIFRCGLLLLFGTFLTITSAQQPCVCPRDRKVVCGSDGKTYDNECLLKCEQQRKPSLALAGQGTCKEINPGCFCGYDNSTLCASDGVTYQSKCEFKCQQAVNDKLRIRNKGKCRKTRKVSELGIQVPLGNSARPVTGRYTTVRNSARPVTGSARTVRNSARPVTGSSRTRFQEVTPSLSCNCPTNLSAVCGTDGITYDNNCLLKCASSEKSGLRVQGEGPCTTTDNVTEKNMKKE